MKLKIKCLTLFLGCFFGTQIHAQNVKYRIISDDPYDIKPVSLSLEPLYMDLNLPNLAMGWSVRAEVLFLKRMELRASYRRSYFDLAKLDADGLPAKKGIKNQWLGEASFAFFLTDRTKKKSMQVVLSQTSSGKYTYTRSISVPGTKRNMFGIRGGAYHMFNPMNLGSDQHGFYKLENEADASDVLEKENISSMYNTSSLFGGIQFKTIKNLFVTADGYGTRSHSSFNDFYIDVLFAPILGFQDVQHADGRIFKVNMESSHVKRIGWRCGWVMRRPESVWLSYKVELGARPGFATKRGLSLENETIYMMFTVGMNIPMRIKHIDKTNN